MKKIAMNFIKMFHVLAIIKRASTPYFLLIIFKTIIQSVLPFIEIIYTKIIIDALINRTEVLKYVLYLISINLIVGIILKIVNYYQEYYSLKLSYNLDNLIALKSFELDYAQVEGNDVMKMIKRAEEGSNSSGGIDSYSRYVLSSLLNSTLSSIYAIILLSRLFVSSTLIIDTKLSRFVNNPLSGIILLVALVLSCIVNAIIMNKDNEKSYQAMLGNIDGNRRFGYFFELCSNYKYGKDIRINSMQGMLLDTMGNAKYSIDKTWRGYSLSNIKYQTIILFMNNFLAFTAYAYVGIKAIYDLISIGNVVAYTSAITIFASKINSFVSTYGEMSLRNSYLDNYFEFLNLQPQNTFGTEEIKKNEEIEIEFKNLSFAYPNQTKLILNDINLKINKGEKIAIVGINGAGKTTLIKLLCRLYEPTSGEILINKKPISSYSKESCYNLFSIVFQDFALFSYSIKDNVASGLDGDEEKVWDCLEKAGIKERVEAMKDKLNTIIYQRNKQNGVEISGGEAQKLAIARALYKDSPIVILDEPTAALDPKSEAEIYEKFQSLVKNKTSIFISHRMSSCKFCDRIIVIDEGKITQSGNHQDLLREDKGLYYKMWNAQAQYYK